MNYKLTLINLDQQLFDTKYKDVVERIQVGHEIEEVLVSLEGTFCHIKFTLKGEISYEERIAFIKKYIDYGEEEQLLVSIRGTNE